MKFERLAAIVAVSCLALTVLHAQSIRDRTRPTYNTGTAVTESQATDLTLTLTKAEMRNIQTWVRTGAVIEAGGKTLVAEILPAEAEIVRVGQRVRAFPPDAKSSMYQAKVTRVIPQGSRIRVEATLPGAGRENSIYYVMEIVADRGEFLTIPNEAIIEEGDKHIVYFQEHPGHFVPREIHTGIQGELFTQVMHGLSEGDEVVTIGSFFIDSEHKLKASGQPMAGNDQHRH